MKKIKKILLIILVITLLFLIVQNTGMVPITLFFFELRVPMIILLLVNLGVGFLIGLLVAFSGKVKPKDIGADDE